METKKIVKNTKRQVKQTKKVANEVIEDEVIKNIQTEITTKVKEKITKEILDDVKKDVSILVKQEVKEDLKKEIEKELKVDNKRRMRGKRGKIFRRDLLIIILLLIIAYLIYYMYNHNYINFSINTNLNNEVLNNDQKATFENDYSYLINDVFVNLPINNTNSLYLYLDSYNEKNIDNSIKLTMAYNKLLKDEFSEDEIKSSYESLFGTTDNFKNVSFDYSCKHFKYSKDQGYILSNDECSTLSTKKIVEKVIKTKVDKDTITITTVMGIFNQDNKSLYNYKNAYDPVATNLSNNFNIINYQNKLSTYKYQFKIENNEYHFNSITKLN